MIKQETLQGILAEGYGISVEPVNNYEFKLSLFDNSGRRYSARFPHSELHNIGKFIDFVKSRLIELLPFPVKRVYVPFYLSDELYAMMNRHIKEPDNELLLDELIGDIDLVITDASHSAINLMFAKLYKDKSAVHCFIWNRELDIWDDLGFFDIDAFYYVVNDIEIADESWIDIWKNSSPDIKNIKKPIIVK